MACDCISFSWGCNLLVWESRRRPCVGSDATELEIHSAALKEVFYKTSSPRTGLVDRRLPALQLRCRSGPSRSGHYLKRPAHSGTHAFCTRYATVAHNFAEILTAHFLFFYLLERNSIWDSDYGLLGIQMVTYGLFRYATKSTRPALHLVLRGWGKWTEFLLVKSPLFNV